ncbi:MAG: hypothetical protein HYS12_27985 [Planctomycetes bacterium]|nr:hypothetical protein [Planctomycetota bacterium]
MPATALNHFNQDIARARAIIRHANPLPSTDQASQLLRSDLLRSAWMFAVGALDAYFCDAYTDLVAASIIAKIRQPAINLPDFFYEIKFPVRAIVEPYAHHENWRWRMAARKMMERETVLSLSIIQTLFNKFFREGQRFFGDLLDTWIPRPDSTRRLFGTTPPAYNAMDNTAKNTARKQARQQMQDRYERIFQRRHDCIHNCDRPRIAPQALDLASTVLKIVQDVEFLVHRCDEHINAEFREFLVGIGCSGAIIRQAGY